MLKTMSGWMGALSCASTASDGVIRMSSVSDAINAHAPASSNEHRQKNPTVRLDLRPDNELGEVLTLESDDQGQNALRRWPS